MPDDDGRVVAGRTAVTVRDAARDEWGPVAALLARSYAEHAAVLPPAIWQAYREELVAIAGRAPISQLVVATAGERLAGTVTFFPDATLDSHGWPPGTASFRLLAVDPRLRRQGIGRVLVEECVRRARRHGAPTLGLHTAEAMVAGVALYRSLGFVPAPHLDFDPHAYYAGDSAPPAEDRVRGAAYVLEL